MCERAVLRAATDDQREGEHEHQSHLPLERRGQSKQSEHGASWEG